MESLVKNNPINASKFCGEVYCSRNFDFFSISCINCSKEFQLPCSKLYTDHVAKCFESENVGKIERNWNDSSEDLYGVTLKAESPQLEDTCLNEFLDLGIEQDERHQYKGQGSSTDRGQFGSLSDKGESISYSDSNVDPLLTKEEETEEKFNSNRKRPKDYMVTERIIDEFKKQPILWDEALNKNVSKAKIITIYQEITKAINFECSLDLTDTQLRTKIIRLTAEYKRALKKKTEIESRSKKPISGSEMLWYYDRMSFFNATATKQFMNESKEENLKVKESAQDENSLQDVTHFADPLNDADEQSKSSESDEEEEVADDNQPESDEIIRISGGKKRVKKETFSRAQLTAMIDLYKSHPILWDSNHPSFIERNGRQQAIEDIVAQFSKDFNHKLSCRQYRCQIEIMRSNYARVLRRFISAKEKEMRSIAKPWYYDMLSFLKPFTKTSETIFPSEDIKFIIENKPLMIEFLEELKTHGCLWNTMHEDWNNLLVKDNAIEELSKMFIKKDIPATKELLLTTIEFILSAQKYNIKSVWFGEHLKFLDGVPRFTKKFCTHCNKRFSTIAKWEEHIVEIGDFPYKCTLCGLGFPCRKKYIYHQKTHQEPFKCDLCDFKAADKRNYIVHMRRHEGVQPFPCQLCEKKFVTSTELRRHTQSHTGEKPFVCELCGKGLSDRGELNEHMKRHRNERDYKCEKCGRAFYSSKTLREHKLVHEKERRYVCLTCGKRFKQSKILRQHKALHAPVKRHECKVCGKLFAQKAGLCSHIKTHKLATSS